SFRWTWTTPAETVAAGTSASAATTGRTRMKRIDPHGIPGRVRRRMDLYEYQGKELFRRFGIPVSEGRLAETPEEALAAADELGGPVLVKAHVPTGGRGK